MSLHSYPLVSYAIVMFLHWAPSCYIVGNCLYSKQFLEIDNLSNGVETKPEMNGWADIFQIVSTELKSFLLRRFTRSLRIFGTIWIRNGTRKVQMAETLTTIINAILLTFRFTWRSPKFVYCAMSIFGSSVMTIFNILRIVSTGVNSTKMSKIFEDILHLRENNPLERWD